MTPKVTIGVPVYNGEKTIRQCLDSIVLQTFSDFELIIADNASVDNTESICREYELADKRITYIRHHENMGGEYNLKYLLGKASGEYFMWAAVDDIRSLDFLEVHVSFLDNNKAYVSSTSQTVFDGKSVPDDMMGDWGLEQDRVALRMLKFFSCWHANAHFYGLHRRACVISWPELYGRGFHGADWTFVMHLAALGKIHRSTSGWVKLGAFGVSAKKNLFAYYRKNILDYFIPFHQTSCKAMRIAKDATWLEYLNLLFKLSLFNIKGFKAQRDHDTWDRRVTEIIYKFNLNKDSVPDIVICGAGSMGRRLYGSLNDRGINATLFIDKNLSGSDLVFDGVSVPVVTMGGAIERGFIKYVIASKEFAEEISSELTLEASSRDCEINIIRLFH
ncbi:glycosyltransferase family 2 protein [Aeromonas sp.]|uniref:glycosyltransferase family 2 protein n=1 Tax=Aeromonas sp. TaxID=647 RepID=UPI00258C8DF1|nr:glycosyltransferase family 2 protein [Aeromonas sp.]MCX7132363.1 glycosyltransferase family 2 protein [Aeromonas sp.]